MANETTTERTSPAAERARELLEPRDTTGALVPVELIDELRERADASPRTLSALAASDVQQAAAAAVEMQRASIALTFPEDWVMFRAKDGAEVCFLEDVGCARVRPLWGISFDSVDYRRDFIEHELDDGHLFIEATARATSALTGEEAVEIGSRSSDGFFGSAWAASESKPVERERVKSNIRKAALANARGRIIRTLTGLGQVPVKELRARGLDTSRVRGVEFQEGTRGGSGSYASEPQIKAIVGEALRSQKVAGLQQLGLDWDHLADRVRAASLTGGRGGKASKLIERLKNAEVGGVTVEQFEQALGVRLVESEPGSEG